MPKGGQLSTPCMGTSTTERSDAARDGSTEGGGRSPRCGRPGCWNKSRGGREPAGGEQLILSCEKESFFPGNSTGTWKASSAATSPPWTAHGPSRTGTTKSSSGRSLTPSRSPRGSSFGDTADPARGGMGNGDDGLMGVGGVGGSGKR